MQAPARPPGCEDYWARCCLAITAAMLLLEVHIPSLHRVIDDLPVCQGREGDVHFSLERIDRLAHGNPGDVKSVGQGVLELRLSHGPGYRVYFTQHGDRLALFVCGGAQNTHQNDI